MRVEAPVVFVGMECLKEVGGLDEDLAVRSGYENPIMGLIDAHKVIAGTENYFDPDRAPRQPTWRVTADFMLRRDGDPSATGADRRRYRATRLGRSDGKSLLTELLPYPHRKSSGWLYERFGRLQTRADYGKAVLPERKRLQRSVIATATRELVVCYGKSNWRQFQELFDGVAWEDVGPFRVGAAGATRIVLTIHFSGYGFNSDAQLEELANVALRSKEVNPAVSDGVNMDLPHVPTARKGGEGSTAERTFTLPPTGFTFEADDQVEADLFALAFEATRFLDDTLADLALDENGAAFASQFLLLYYGARIYGATTAGMMLLAQRQGREATIMVRGKPNSFQWRLP